MQVWGLKFAIWVGHSQGCLVRLGISLAKLLILLAELLVCLFPEYSLDWLLYSHSPSLWSQPSLVLPLSNLPLCPALLPSHLDLRLGDNGLRSLLSTPPLVGLWGSWERLLERSYNGSLCHSGKVQQEVFRNGPPAPWLTRIPISSPFMSFLCSTRQRLIHPPSQNIHGCWPLWSARHRQKGWLLVRTESLFLSAFRTARVSWRPSFSWKAERSHQHPLRFWHFFPDPLELYYWYVCDLNSKIH